MAACRLERNLARQAATAEYASSGKLPEYKRWVDPAITERHFREREAVRPLHWDTPWDTAPVPVDALLGCCLCMAKGGRKGGWQAGWQAGPCSVAGTKQCCKISQVAAIRRKWTLQVQNRLI
jgi:hypothetical protein